MKWTWFGVALVLAACNGSSGAPDAGVDAGPVDAGPPVANGTLGTWSELAPMPTPRANHCSAVAGGYLLVIGGNHAADAGGFVTSSDVEGAPLLGDGGLGPWRTLGPAPGPVSECTVAADGSTLILVDGIYTQPAQQGTVFSATVADGGLSTWSVAGNLPGGRDVFDGEADVVNGELVVLESEVFADGGGGEAVLTAPADGLSASAWTVSPLLPSFIGRPQWAFDGTTAYVLGGYDGSTSTIATGYGANLTDAGLGAAFPVTPLPEPRNFGRAVAVDGYVFVVGGRDGVYAGDGDTAVVSAPIEDGGALGSWTTQSALPVGRTNQAIAVGGSFIYVTGGAVSGPGDDRVFAARIRFAP